ncbi:MAG: Rpp14/Pop5 family protein [Candidatus Pacearchaeota archaeon]|jgi:RNase P/RNase MRP subunit POP5
MKPLKPSMREDKRYLLISGENLKEDVVKSIKEFIGILGLAKSNLSFIELKKDKAIICVDRKSLNHVKASFAMCNEKIDVLKVSGTLKGLKTN